MAEAFRRGWRAGAVQNVQGQRRLRLEEEVRNAIFSAPDDATLVGAPPKMLAGRSNDLRIPDAVRYRGQRRV